MKRRIVLAALVALMALAPAAPASAGGRYRDHGTRSCSGYGYADGPGRAYHSDSAHSGYSEHHDCD